MKKRDEEITVVKKKIEEPKKTVSRVPKIENIKTKRCY